MLALQKISTYRLRQHQAMLEEINKFLSRTQAAKIATMVGVYDPETGRIAVGSSNERITAADLHPDTVRF